MPLDEKEMDKVFDLKRKEFLTKMDVGKFYSIDEITELILGKKLDISEIKRRDFLEGTKGMVSVILEMAYVESVIEAQFAIGSLRYAEKNGIPYYSKA